jgi:phosphoglycolate phosphatase
MSKPISEQILETVGLDGHVIWDWNGTLLNDVDHAVSTMNHLLSDHGLPLLNIDRYRQLFEFPVLNYYTALGFDFSKETFESLCHRFVERFMAGFKDLPLVNEMEAVLRQIQLRGVRQSILSATVQSDLDEMISHFRLGETFSAVYGINNKLAGSKVERGHELMQISGISAKRTVIVGDTLHDLEVARELGINAILVGHGHQCVTKLRTHHERVIEIGAGL